MSPSQRQSPTTRPGVRHLWRIATLLVLALSLTASPVAASSPVAQPSPPSWTQTSLTEPALRLFTPASGALFARTATALQRSDDGGLTWRPVSLPATPEADPDAVVVDPTNHTTIYLAAADGVYKTDDDAASWRLVLPADPKTPTFTTLAVSPANPSTIWVLFTSPTSNDLRFQRSLDGGASWEMLPDAAALPPGAIPQKCTWSVPVLHPHPSDPDRLFRAASCNIRGDQVPLKETRDGGRTLSEAIYQYPLGRVTRVAAGQSETRQRIYLTLDKDSRGGGSLLAVSDDDGHSWQILLEYSGGGGMTGGGPDVHLAGMAIDPTNADHVLLGLNASRGAWAMPPALRLSLDGGQTWLDASPEGIGRLADVAFGFDGRTLFAAGEAGVWRAPAP